MTTLVLALLLALGAGQSTGQEQERPKVPKDSVELVVLGCLKGRVLAVSDVRQTDTQSGPIVRARSFRLAGKKDVMDDVKREDGHLVEVTGLVRRAALDDRGVKVGKGITIAGGPPVAGRSQTPAPTNEAVVMDVWSVRLRSTSCTIDK